MSLGTPIFPTTLDTAATLGPTSGIVAGTTPLNAVGTNQGDQLGITNNLINTVVALETAVGVTSSSVTTSLTYGVNHLTSATPYTTTTSSFTIPAAGSPVTLAITSAAWPTVGQVVEINDGTHYGFFEITTVTSGISIAVTNRGYNGNPVSGTMATAALLSLASAGQSTATQAGLVPTPPNTVTTFFRGDATFATPPSVSVSAPGYAPTASAASGTFLNGNTGLYSTPPSATATVAGYVPTPPNNTTTFLRGDATFTAVPYANVTGTPVSDPFTTTTSSFVIPAAGSPVTLAITSASWPTVGQVVEINDGTHYGFFEITTVTSGTSIAVTNRGYNGNPVSGTMATAASISLACPGQATSSQPGLLPTPTGSTTTFLRADASYTTPPSATATVAGYVPTPPNNTMQFLRGDATWTSPGVTTTSTNGTFTVPASGSTVTVTIIACTWPIQGQKVYISDGTHTMFGTLTAIGSSTSITVLNTGDTGNSVSGTMATNAGVSLVDYQSVVWDKFTAMDNDPPATNYATFDVINNMSTLGFVKATATGAVFKSVLPQFAQLGSGIIVKVIWASVAAITGNVTFGAAFEPTTLATINSDHFGTQATTTTTVSGTAGVPNTTSIAIPYSTMGSAVAGNLYRLQIQRLATDTMVGNAEALAVTVESGVL